MSAIEIVLKEGPVRIRSLTGAGVDKTYPLWGEISASEFLPPNIESAFYVLSLRKRGPRPGEVAEVDCELVSALRLLATAWPFSSGSFMVLDSRDALVSPRFESNAERVRSDLLASAGKKMACSPVTIAYETLATYNSPPLDVASVVAKAATNDYGLRRLLGYHQTAWVGYYGRARSDRSSWFIDLYKVRDLLKKLYGGGKAAKAQLGIVDSDWSFFGQILNNNDLRHAEVAGVIPAVAKEDVDRLYRLARTWTRSHLKVSGLPIL
ncbi:MAG TPA: hypothetical protein VGW77_19165 [Candidatus Binatia bacterium]|nr:hypothetical protein [Candidatus Binatia bacterium]